MNPEFLKYLGMLQGPPKIGPYKENVPKPRPIPDPVDAMGKPLNQWGMSSQEMDEFLKNSAIDATNPIGFVAGSVKKLPSAMSHLAKYFKASGNSEYDNFMTRKAEIRDYLHSKPKHPLDGNTQPRQIYHGTKALFEEPDPNIGKFTGAGDQWQGHGLYLAGARPVAEYYKGLTGKDIDLNRFMGRNFNVDEFDKTLDRVIGRLNSKVIPTYKNNFASFLPEDEKMVDALNSMGRRIHNDPFSSVSSSFESLTATKDWVKNAFKDLEKQKKRLGKVHERVSNFRSELIKQGIDEELLDKSSKEIDKYINNTMNYADPRVVLLQLYKDSKTSFLEERDLLKYIKGDIDEYTKILSLHQSPFSHKNKTGKLHEKVSNLYSGKFFANPDELFNLDLPFDAQPSSERIKGALSQFSQNPRISPMLPARNTYENFANMMKQKSGEDYFRNSSLMRYGDVGFSDVTPEHLAYALKDKGIVGNSYLNRNAREAGVPPRSALDTQTNFVANDPSRVDFRDIAALMAMIGGSSAINAKKKKEKK